MNAEDKHLLQCVRSALGGPTADSAWTAGLDWSHIGRSAEKHQVQPLLYEAVRATGREEQLCRSTRDALALEYHRTGMRNAFISQRIGDLVQNASCNDVRVMLLKGAVLAYEGYREPGHRAFGDVDLLVREEDFATLSRILDAFGYATSSPQLRVRDLPRYAHYVKQFRFGSSAVPAVEVHFRLLNTGMVGAKEPAWKHAVQYKFGNAVAWRPSSEHFLLHLCLHAQQHAFAILRLFTDIAVWVRTHAIDVERYVALARDHRLATASYYALAYTDVFLGLRDASSLLERLRPRRWKRSLFERLWRDDKIRSLRASLGSTEAELPRAFLLGEAPIAEKAIFLWNVAFPRTQWLNDSNEPVIRRRVRRLGRILSIAGRAW